jgi:hypothetical protein
LSSLRPAKGKSVNVASLSITGNTGSLRGGTHQGGQQDQVAAPCTLLLSKKSVTFAFYVLVNTDDAMYWCNNCL